MTSNIMTRPERTSDRMMFIPMEEWESHVSAEEKTRVREDYTRIISESSNSPTPKDLTFRHASYIYTKLYEDRFKRNLEIVQDVTGLKTRTCMSYATPLTWLEYIWDYCGDEFENQEMTKENQKEWMENT